MRKSNTDTLWTGDFVEMCIAHFLIFSALFMVLPWLPVAMKEQMGLPFAEGAWLYVAFLVGMLVVGPFHAYLSDAYKRKHVFLFSAALTVVAGAGYLFVANPLQAYLLALFQGACFSLTLVSDLTVDIDITHSSCRTSGNLVYAWVGRMGVMAGAWLGAWLYLLFNFQAVVLGAMVLAFVGLFFGSQIYLPFRAPNGEPLFTIDRFFLPRAWLPAIGVVGLSAAAGSLLPLLLGGDRCPLIGLGLLAVGVIPLIGLFVRLSHHCQRGTANATCYLAIESGMLLGLIYSYLHPDTVVIHLHALIGAVVSLLFLLFVAYPYYRHHRLR